MEGACRQRFEGLYDEHCPAVRGYLMRRADPELAQDALSETFLAAWRRLDDLPAGDPLPWLLGTARKALANQRRSARRHGGLREHVAAHAEPARAELAEQVADADLVRRALAGLAESDRETLMLVAWEGLEPRRAAAAAGCSRATFAVRLHRARVRLDRALIALENSLSEPALDALEAR